MVFLVNEDSVGTKCHCLLEEFNHFIMENERLKKLVSEQDAAMKTKFIGLIDIENIATFEIEKGFLAKFIAESIFSQHGKGLREPARETVLLEISLPCILTSLLILKK